MIIALLLDRSLDEFYEENLIYNLNIEKEREFDTENYKLDK